MIEEASEEADHVEDAIAFIHAQILPGAGGMLDQDPRFCDAVRVVRPELERLREWTDERLGPS